MTPQDFDIIARTLKRTRVTLLMTGLFYICAGLMLMSNLPLLYESNLMGEFKIVIGIVLVPCILFSLRYGIAFTYRAIKWWNIEQSPVYLLLKEHPQQLVWIYVVTTQGSAELFFSSENRRAVVICLSDGSRYQLYSSDYFVFQLIETLSHFAPQARVGYQREWEKEYKEDSSQFGANHLSDRVL